MLVNNSIFLIFFNEFYRIIESFFKLTFINFPYYTEITSPIVFERWGTRRPKRSSSSFFRRFFLLMKKVGLILCVFIALCLSIAYGVKKLYLQPMELMSLKEVCRRWGTQPLDVAKFKAAKNNRSVRAKMACSILKNQKKYIGWDSLKIRETFGDGSGYFFSESFPTYLINKPTEENREVWQILFFVDGNHTVSEIVVHKNCCY